MDRKWEGRTLLVAGKRFELRATEQELREAAGQLWLHHEIWLILNSATQAFASGHATYKDSFETLRDIFTEQGKALGEIVAVLASVDSCFEPPGLIGLIGKPDRPEIAKAILEEALTALSTQPPEGHPLPVPVEE